MEDPKALIDELILKFNNTDLKASLKEIGKKHRDKIEKLDSIRNVTNDNLAIISRKNKQLEAEIQQLETRLEKNNELYNRRNLERLKHSKMIIEYEQKNEDLENQIVEIERKTQEKEEEIQKLQMPSDDFLFYEIAKGFGITFVKKQGKLYAKIKNVEKNDIYMVDTSEGSVGSVCNKIWDLIG